jgi:hypothetical protein
MIWAIAFFVAMVVIAVVVTVVLKQSKEQDETFEEIGKREKKWHRASLDNQRKAMEILGSQSREPKPIEVSEFEIPPGWEDKVREELKRHRADPNYVAVMPMADHTSTIQTREDKLWDIARSGVMTGMWTPRWAAAMVEIVLMGYVDSDDYLKPPYRKVVIMGKEFSLKNLIEIKGDYELPKKLS